MTPIFAGIDAGGTAFKCIVAQGPDNILSEHKVPVTSPEVTLAQCSGFFQQAALQHGPLQALGIASFGPIERNPGAANYGYITSTPKPGWANTAIVQHFTQALDIPIVFDTDVNGALLAEATWGAAKGHQHAVYVTVGTGIGIGAMHNGQLIHGVMHPEAGHMKIAKMPGDDFAGHCPFHGDCLEGLASGPALAARLGYPAEEAEDSNPIWQTWSFYLGAMCVNLAMHYSPAKIILGGGVLARESLIQKVREQFTTQMNGYLQRPNAEAIVPAALGSRAGALGAIALAQTQMGNS